MAWGLETLTSAEGIPRFFTFVPSSTTTKRDLNGAFISRMIEQNTFDEYGFPTQVIMTTENEDGSRSAYQNNNKHLYP